MYHRLRVSDCRLFILTFITSKYFICLIWMLCVRCSHSYSCLANFRSWNNIITIGFHAIKNFVKYFLMQILRLVQFAHVNLLHWRTESCLVWKWYNEWLFINNGLFCLQNVSEISLMRPHLCHCIVEKLCIFCRLILILLLGDKVRIMEPFSMHQLLKGVDLSKYYRYNGSLTTPNKKCLNWEFF